MSTALEVLRRARARLAQPGAWTKDFDARNAAGEPVDADCPEATCWCAWGAVIVESGGDYGAAIEELAWALSTPREARISAFNDAQETVEPVLAMFDRAIARLEELPPAGWDANGAPA